jgi:hypothetical protein
MKEILIAMKRLLGTSCTYISFEQEKNVNYLKAVIKNSNGGKDTVRQKINVPLKELTEKDYQDMLTVLLNRAYVS